MILVLAILLAVVVVLAGTAWLVGEFVAYLARQWRDEDVFDERARMQFADDGGREPMEYRPIQQLPPAKDIES